MKKVILFLILVLILFNLNINLVSSDETDDIQQAEMDIPPEYRTYVMEPIIVVGTKAKEIKEDVEQGKTDEAILPVITSSEFIEEDSWNDCKKVIKLREDNNLRLSNLESVGKGYGEQKWYLLNKKEFENVYNNLKFVQDYYSDKVISYSEEFNKKIYGDSNELYLILEMGDNLADYYSDKFYTCVKIELDNKFVREEEKKEFTWGEKEEPFEIYLQGVKEQCSKSCCETDDGLLKDHPNIKHVCYDKDGAHWDEWGTEYSCSRGGSKVTGSAVLNFLVGWVVKDEKRCEEKDTFSAKTGGLSKQDFLNFGLKHSFIVSKIIAGKALSIEEKKIALDYIANIYANEMPYASKYLKMYLNSEQLKDLPKSEWYGDKGTTREGTLYPVYNIVPDWTEAGGELDSETLLDLSYTLAENPEEILEIYESGEEAWILAPTMASSISPLGVNVMGFFSVYIQKGENGKAIIRIKDFYDWFAPSAFYTVWPADKYIIYLARVFGFNIRDDIAVGRDSIEVKDVTLVNLGQPYIMWGEWEVSEEDFLKYNWANKKVEENK